MRPYLYLLIFAIIISCTITVSYAGTDGNNTSNDSSNTAVFLSYKKKLSEMKQQQIDDSLKKVRLKSQLQLTDTTDSVKIVELQQKLQQLDKNEKLDLAQKKSQIDSLRQTAVGYPVMGILDDTLFQIYTRIGEFTPRERATNISKKIGQLYDDDFLKIDSLQIIESQGMADIVYRNLIIMSISESDALWENKSKLALAEENTEIIKKAIVLARDKHSLVKLFIRIGLALLVIAGGWLIIWLIGKAYFRLLKFVISKKEKWLKNLSYKDYTFLSADQELRLIMIILKIFRWFLVVLFFYLILPVIFSIFPFTRDWADNLFRLVWSPFKGIFIAVWNYLPNIFTILVIFIVMRYFIRFIKYIFSEIEAEKLNITGFHPDWAMPTFGIIRFLLYAFMFVLIFPYLPGHESTAFKGVSVFIGVLFSLGSSSAISNMIAGLVITYMRPFKVGDRIKIGEMTGDVIEKTLLVTRLRTIKNEEITIPNSSVLSGNTINYSAYSKQDGLIIHTTVTIGYDIPWKDMHQALIDAALKTNLILSDPKPFVLQTSLDDFYISYQLNAYTREANKQAAIYSELHQNIQDICNERGIEIMSPHYNAARDGNTKAIPPEYLPKDYEAPGFKVKTNMDN